VWGGGGVGGGRIQLSQQEVRRGMARGQGQGQLSQQEVQQGAGSGGCGGM
jgi:hypothetical protein